MSSKNLLKKCCFDFAISWRNKSWYRLWGTFSNYAIRGIICQVYFGVFTLWPTRTTACMVSELYRETCTVHQCNRYVFFFYAVGFTRRVGTTTFSNTSVDFKVMGGIVYKRQINNELVQITTHKFWMVCLSTGALKRKLSIIILARDKNILWFNPVIKLKVFFKDKLYASINPKYNTNPKRNKHQHLMK